MTPVYEFISLEARDEEHLRQQVLNLRDSDPQRFGNYHWQQLKVERQTFSIDEEAVDFIQKRATHTHTALAVRYRATPPSQRLAAAQIKLKRFLEQLNQPGSHKHAQRNIAQLRNRITEIKYDLARRSQHVMWMVGGLLPEDTHG